MFIALRWMTAQWFLVQFNIEADGTLSNSPLTVFLNIV